ncbi:MAG: hypothetical protein IPL61_09280 [Myxococcales bacterium]|nr:hypothetical protein [Myxococcales bacterium]
MRHMLAMIAVAGLGVGAASADEHATRGGAAVVVPVLGEDGHPTYCTRNLTAAVASPLADGGYRMVGLAAGRYQVRLVLTHEHVDVLVTVPRDGDVIVPPVIARGRCHSVAVTARTDGHGGRSPSWALRYGRSYRAAFGVRADEPSWAPRSRK